MHVSNCFVCLIFFLNSKMFKEWDRMLQTRFHPGIRPLIASSTYGLFAQGEFFTVNNISTDFEL